MEYERVRLGGALQDDDPMVDITNGITYRRTEPPQQLLARWKRQVSALCG